MSNGRVILPKERFALTIDRLCHQLIENHDDFQNTCLVGIQQGGVPLVNRIHQRLLEITGAASIENGKLDITFYRDDFRHRSKPIRASVTEMDFLIEGKNVVLMDDVLYTGRSVQAAMSALGDFGRPQKVELLTLVDRRFNRDLPIKSDYTGIRVDSLDDAYVRVEWKEVEGEDIVWLFPQKED
jgi:pyrimidine operon attenuation protein/uracil phosphoribosyltransferase